MGLEVGGITQQQLRQELEVFGQQMMDRMEARITPLENRVANLEKTADDLLAMVGDLAESMVDLKKTLSELDDYVRNGLSENVSEILGKLTADL